MTDVEAVAAAMAATEGNRVDLAVAPHDPLGYLRLARAAIETLRACTCGHPDRRHNFGTDFCGDCPCARFMPVVFA